MRWEQETEPGTPDPEDKCSEAVPQQPGMLSQGDDTGRGAQPRVLLWKEKLGSAWRLLLARLLMWNLGEMQLRGPGHPFSTRVTVVPLEKGEERGFSSGSWQQPWLIANGTGPSIHTKPLSGGKAIVMASEFNCSLQDGPVQAQDLFLSCVFSLEDNNDFVTAATSGLHQTPPLQRSARHLKQ